MLKKADGDEGNIEGVQCYGALVPRPIFDFVLLSNSMSSWSNRWPRGGLGQQEPAPEPAEWIEVSSTG
jgi:hypothetical protein